MIRLLSLVEVDSEEQEGSGGSKLVLKEDLRCFATLTLELLQEDVPRQEKPKVLKGPEVFSWMVFDEGKFRVLLEPKISLARLDDEESSLKRCEWWLGHWQEMLSFFFNVSRGFEGRMIFEGFEDRMIFEGGKSSFGWFPNLEEQE